MTQTAKANQHATGAPRWLALTMAAAITLIGGALYGSYAQRWNKTDGLSTAVARLDAIPRECGNWKAVEDIAIDEQTLQILDCAGTVSRRYVNRETGQSVQCAILVGRSGPIAVHTPEVCFSSRDYEIEKERTATTIEDGADHRHTFWKSDFSSRNTLADGLRVYYAWSTGTTWKASPSPRFEFAGEPLLYKCQLATNVSPSLARDGTDPARQFLEEFVKSAWLTGPIRNHD